MDFVFVAVHQGWRGGQRDGFPLLSRGAETKPNNVLVFWIILFGAQNIITPGRYTNHIWNNFYTISKENGFQNIFLNANKILNK